MIESLAGKRIAFAKSGEFDRTVMKDAAVGDGLLFHDKTSGDTSAPPRSRELTEGHSCSTTRWTCSPMPSWNSLNMPVQAGRFKIASGRTRQRLLVQSGPGTVRNCSFARQGSSLELNSVMPYVEGGIPRDIIIATTFLRTSPPLPHGSAISVYAHTFLRENAPLLRNIQVVGNHFSGCAERAITLDSVESRLIVSNRIERQRGLRP